MPRWRCSFMLQNTHAARVSFYVRRKDAEYGAARAMINMKNKTIGLVFMVIAHAGLCQPAQHVATAVTSQPIDLKALQEEILSQPVNLKALQLREAVMTTKDIHEVEALL